MKVVYASIIFVLFVMYTQNVESTKCAIVTLIYGENDIGFVMGGIALGKSLINTETEMTMIALVTKDVSLRSRWELEESGWQINQVDEISNPTEHYVLRFDKIFTKLHIFAMDRYDRVIYLDADTIVNENIDSLCDCNSEYCAVVRNTFFNAGVMVVTPSQDAYNSMINSLTYDTAYPDNDQGFLNAYYWNSERCDFFDPRVDKDDVGYKSCRRLPADYNGDVAIYTLRGDKWLYDPVSKEDNKRPIITHFTFGAMKPWHWWTYIFISEHWHWWNIYASYDIVVNPNGALYVSIITIIALMLFRYVRPVFICCSFAMFHLMNFIFMVVAFNLSLLRFSSPYLDWIVFTVVYCIGVESSARMFMSKKGLSHANRIVFNLSIWSVIVVLLFFPIRITFFPRLIIMICWAIVFKIIFLTDCFLKHRDVQTII